MRPATASPLHRHSEILWDDGKRYNVFHLFISWKLLLTKPGWQSHGREGGRYLAKHRSVDLALLWWRREYIVVASLHCHATEAEKSEASDGTDLAEV